MSSGPEATANLDYSGSQSAVRHTNTQSGTKADPTDGTGRINAGFGLEYCSKFGRGF